MDSEKDGSAVYSDLLKATLEGEYSRKASIEQRGLSLISTSGGLVTLLVALGALLLGKDPTLPVVSTACIAASSVCFVVAAGLGLASNSPRSYFGLMPDDLDRIVTEQAWKSERDEALFLVAQFRANGAKAAYLLNNKKARLIQFGIGAEVLGVALVACSLMTALLS